MHNNLLTIESVAGGLTEVANSRTMVFDSSSVADGLYKVIRSWYDGRRLHTITNDLS